MVRTLALVHFGSLRIVHTIKTNSIKLHTGDPDRIDIDFLKKDLGIVSPYFLCYIVIADQISFF